MIEVRLDQQAGKQVSDLQHEVHLNKDSKSVRKKLFSLKLYEEL